MNQNTTARKFSARFCFVVVAACVLATVSLFLLAPIATASSGGFPLYSWGNNAQGQLGLGDSGAGTNRNMPTRVGEINNWIAIAQGAETALAINANGELFAWGHPWTAPQMGQAGVQPPAEFLSGNNIARPMRVGIADNWTYVSARGQVASAINDNGELFIWGAGIGNNANVPTQVGLGAVWVRAVVAPGMMLAITDQGHLYSWGTGNASGQLGRDTNIIPMGTPGRVGERSDWINISIGSNSVLALSGAGYIYSWGANSLGQLGHGNTTNLSAPVRIGAADNWVSIGKTSGGAAAAINSDGELFTWGSTANGQLGRSATAAAPANLPGIMGAADNWQFLTSANSHFLAFNDDYELWAWGSNAFGQLGIDELGGYRNTPQLVLQTYGFSGAARGGGTYSLMLIRTTPADASLTLTKNLIKPTGTPVPNITFSFTFTPHSFNDNTANLTPVPAIPTRTVTISTSNTSTPNTPEAGITTTSNSVDVLEDITFTQTGVFAWTVTEVQSATGIGSNSSVDFSEASYRLRVYVIQESVGAPLEVYATTIYRLATTDGIVVDPPVKVNNLSFTNTYIRTRPADALTISKTVTGQFANLTTPFSFEVTLTRTALCANSTNFVGRIMQGNTQIGADIPFTSGVQETVTLLHNQRLVFDSLVVGTHFTVTELASPEFIASVELVVDGQAINIAPNTVPNTNLPLGNHLVGAQSNTADFTNAHSAVPPTGLSISNYTTLLIPAAVITLLAILALRARRRIEELSYLQLDSLSLKGPPHT